MVRLIDIAEEDSWEAEYDFGRQIWSAGCYARWICSDGEEHDADTLTPIEEWITI